MTPRNYKFVGKTKTGIREKLLKAGFKSGTTAYKNAYFKAWSDMNPECIQEIRRKHAQANRKKLTAYARKWRARKKNAQK